MKTITRELFIHVFCLETYCLNQLFKCMVDPNTIKMYPNSHGVNIYTEFASQLSKALYKDLIIYEVYFDEKTNN